MTYQNNNSFSRDIPKLQLAWDSVSSGALKKCPRYYELTIIEGYGNYGIDYSGDDAHFGILFHSACEIYEHQRAVGADHNSAINYGVYCLLINTWDFIRKRPWISGEPTKTRKTLVRSFILYCDQHENDPIETNVLENGEPAIEVSFRLDLSEIDGTFQAPDGSPYLLCGHMDKIGTRLSDGVSFVMDKKTTRHYLNDEYFAQYTPDNQISIYSIAGRIIALREIKGVIIDGVQVQVTSNDFKREEIPRSESQLTEWLTDFSYKLRENERYVADNYWPQNDRACGYGRFPCRMRDICKRPPEERQDLLNAFYTRRTWDPLIPR